MGVPSEPNIHSHITDVLDDSHPLAYETVYCDKCRSAMLHAANNECMQTWIETGKGNFCTHCFCTMGIEVLEDDMGLNA